MASCHRNSSRCFAKSFQQSLRVEAWWVIAAAAATCSLGQLSSGHRCVRSRWHPKRPEATTAACDSRSSCVQASLKQCRDESGCAPEDTPRNAAAKPLKAHSSVPRTRRCCRRWVRGAVSSAHLRCHFVESVRAPDATCPSQGFVCGATAGAAWRINSAVGFFMRCGKH